MGEPPPCQGHWQVLPFREAPCQASLCLLGPGLLPPPGLDPCHSTFLKAKPTLAGVCSPDGPTQIQDVESRQTWSQLPQTDMCLPGGPSFGARGQGPRG